jgi:hypothetical protein
MTPDKFIFNFFSKWSPKREPQKPLDFVNQHFCPSFFFSSLRSQSRSKVSISNLDRLKFDSKSMDCDNNWHARVLTHRLIARNLMPDIFRSNISKEWRWQENHSDVRYEHHKHKERRRNDYCWFIRSFEHCQRYFDFWLVLLTLEKPSEKMMSFCLEM